MIEQAKWIWIKQEKCEKNFFVYFRKKFSLDKEVKSVFLHISADSRYVVYINGHRLGQGPARYWPNYQQYDTYDVSGFINYGDNVIAGLVYWFGESNFQYIHNEPGLLCQIEILNLYNEKIFINSDKTWKFQKCNAFENRVPRISVQQGFEEQYDANKEIKKWNNLEFNDCDWENATEITKFISGENTNFKLIQRDIPFLSEEEVYPVNILNVDIVKPLPYNFTIDLTPVYFPGRTDSNVREIKGMLIVNLIAEKDEKIILHCFPWVEWKNVYINDKLYCRNERKLSVSLKQGKNQIKFDITGNFHLLQFSISIDTIQNLKFENWNVVIDNEKRQIPQECFSKVNVHALTTLEKTVYGVTAKIENISALCSSNMEYTIIKNNSIKNGDVRILIDFGKELNGYLQFEIYVKEKGVILDFNFFEGIQDGKIQYTYPLNNSFRYITAGNGKEEYRTFVRHGFRYCFLTIRNLNSDLKIRYIRTILSTFPVRNIGEFKCSDELLNKIWEVGRWTLRMCMEDTFIDCPAYEQTHWVGDARNEMLINYVTYGSYDLARHCLQQVAISLERSDITESHVPSGWQNLLPAWSFLWMLACYEYYLYTGDFDFVKKIYPSLKKNVEGIKKYINEKGLFSIDAWNMLDWAPMDTPAGIVTHNNCFIAGALDATAKLAKILNKKEDVKMYINLRKNIIQGINKYCWNEKRKAYVDCLKADGKQSEVISQQTNTIAYLYDCVPTKRIKYVLKLILPDKNIKNIVRAGSPFFMFFTLEALAKSKNYKKMIELIKEKWGFMIEKGATTFWETFPGFEKNRWTRSWCHAWSSAPTYFLSTYILGIKPLSAGFKKFTKKPNLAGLKFVKGKIPTPNGSLCSFNE